MELRRQAAATVDEASTARSSRANTYSHEADIQQDGGSRQQYATHLHACPFSAMTDQHSQPFVWTRLWSSTPVRPSHRFHENAARNKDTREWCI